MQRERLKTPYAWTWEIPAAVTLVVLFGLVLGVQGGRTVANLLAGAVTTWPATDTAAAAPSPIGSAFWTSLPGVLAGDAAAGLPAPLPDALAPPWLVWASVGGVELLFLGLAAVIGVKCYTRWGPGRMRGMASAAEAEQILGLSRLRKVSALVRPDTYGKRSPRPPEPEQNQLTPTINHTNDNDNERLTSPWLTSRRRKDTR